MEKLISAFELEVLITDACSYAMRAGMKMGGRCSQFPLGPCAQRVHKYLMTWIA